VPQRDQLPVLSLARVSLGAADLVHRWNWMVPKGRFRCCRDLRPFLSDVPALLSFALGNCPGVFFLETALCDSRKIAKGNGDL
jgi:hypothetical protein